jgi:hypothetical protein
MECVSRVRSMVEAAIGEGTAEALVEEQEQEGKLNAFGGWSVGVAGAIALQQSMPLEFAEVVAKLVEGVGSWGELKGGENGLMDLFGGPAAEGRTGMQENLQ